MPQSHSVFLIAILSLLINACATTGSDPNAMRLSGNQLTIALSSGGSHAHWSYKHSTRYSLYRMQPSNRTTSLARHAEISLFSRKSLNVAVENHPIASADKINNLLTFELPNYFNPGNDCFALVNIGSWITELNVPGNFPSRYLIGLKPFSLTKALLLEKNKLTTSEQNIQMAKTNITHNPSYINQSCQRVTPNYPPRPINAYPPDEADQLAEAVVLNAMSLRLGCESTSEVMKQLNLINNWERFQKRFSCGRTELNKLFPQNKLTPFIDYFESRLLSCAVNNQNDDKQMNCFASYAVLLIARFYSDKKDVYDRLSQPYLVWQKRTSKMRSKAALAYNRCQHYASTINNAPLTLSSIQHKIKSIELKLNDSSAQRDASGAYYFSAPALSCNKKLDDYKSNKGVFIGTR